jgi:PBSX family phage terminase large subunit
MNKEIKLLDHQWQFVNSLNRFTALIGGIGSGKTYTLAVYILSRVTKHPDALHFIGANTFSQLKNSTLSAVFSLLNDLEIPFSYNQSSGLLEFAGGKVLCKSMENFNALRGIEIGSFILDEARDLKQEAFDMMMGRLRDKNVKGDLQGRVVTSPAGYNWIYDYFHPSGEFHNKNFKLIQCTSMANKHLPDGYLESIKDQYSETFYKQEILGEFINLTAGKTYYAFERDDNVSEVSRVNGSIYCGLDFNVNPLCGVVFQVINGKIRVIDEMFLENSNTFEACDWLVKHNYRGCQVIPDSTGKNRKTSGKSDHDILKENGFTVMTTRNPMVFDRVNNINRLLTQNKIIIDPKCKKLINDLEKVTWKDNKLDQKTDPMLTHISDALGYGAWKLMPINSGITKAKIRMG